MNELMDERMNEWIDEYIPEVRHIVLCEPKLYISGQVLDNLQQTELKKTYKFKVPLSPPVTLRSRKLHSK